MYEEVFRRILESSKTKSLTFFVGAGVSALSGAPKWSDLIDEMSKQLCMKTKINYTTDEYLRIPQIYYCSINKDKQKYYSFLEGCFNKTELEPNEIHKKILDLKPASIITTNFDNLLEQAALKHCKGYEVIACDKEIPKINGNKFILKLHGDLQHKNIVLKEEDYLNYSENFKLTETILKSIFSTNTVVFIGYGLNDYNIKLVLNWAKSLLKNKFNKPIFIYTNNEKLSESELLYHEKRGLTVVEYYKLKKDEEAKLSFEERYNLVIEAIKKSSVVNVDGKDKYERFNVLYELIKPLNKCKALRTHDLHKKLYPHVIVEENGTIFIHPKGTDIFNYFLELNNMNSTQINNLPKDIRDKYKTIKSVLSKARVLNIKDKETYRSLNDIEIKFADSNCITFDFKEMVKRTESNPKTLSKKYRKAYYLARLNKFQDAYKLFSEVAMESFDKQNLVYYYLSQVNKNNLVPFIKNIPFTTSNTQDIKGIEIDEGVFYELPVEFQVDYVNFKDLNSVNLLYENAYNTFIEGEKLKKAIESDIFESGLASAAKVLCRIKNNLHFLLGNGIFADKFSEFTNTIKYLISLLVYKYTVQNKKKILPSMFDGIRQYKVNFDEVYFYCFVEYFKSEEIRDLFIKHEIKQIEFINKEIIEKSIRNLMDYYVYLVSRNTTFYQLEQIELKLKSCLTLLRYTTLSQNLIDKICRFLFEYEFRHIRIDDKIIFIDSQLYKRKKYSNVTRQVIGNKLLYYIDEHINSLKNGKTFELPSTHQNINYYNLIHYIDENDKTTISRKLACYVTDIIGNGYNQMYESVFDYYFDYLSDAQKKKIVLWAKKNITINFNFGMFYLLVLAGVPITKELICFLKEFLRDKCYSKELKTKIQVYPPRDKYEELIDVGYWIRLGLLPKEEFEEFLGISDKFDFYYLYKEFDFDKFDICWLFYLNEHTYKTIASDEFVKEKIRQKISEKLLSNTLIERDQKELTKILVKYFC